MEQNQKQNVKAGELAMLRALTEDQKDEIVDGLGKIDRNLISRSDGFNFYDMEDALSEGNDYVLVANFGASEKNRGEILTVNVGLEDSADGPVVVLTSGVEAKEASYPINAERDRMIAKVFDKEALRDKENANHEVVSTLVAAFVKAGVKLPDPGGMGRDERERWANILGPLVSYKDRKLTLNEGRYCSVSRKESMVEGRVRADIVRQFRFEVKDGKIVHRVITNKDRLAFVPRVRFDKDTGEAKIVKQPYIIPDDVFAKLSEAGFVTAVINEGKMALADGEAVGDAVVLQRHGDFLNVETPEMIMQECCPDLAGMLVDGRLKKGAIKKVDFLGESVTPRQAFDLCCGKVVDVEGGKHRRVVLGKEPKLSPCSESGALPKTEKKAVQNEGRSRRQGYTPRAK